MTCPLLPDRSSFDGLTNVWETRYPVCAGMSGPYLPSRLVGGTYAEGANSKSLK